MFRLFGFPVQIRIGFVMFLALIIFLYQGPIGYWLAAGLFGFTLIHELGHAVAARSAGAAAEISLDFLAGYTSFRPDPQRPISRPQRALISVAGPAVQIVVGVVVLLLAGTNPLLSDSVRASAFTIAMWWSGPVIGVLNLLPVLPLDGGHLALVGVESVTKRDAVKPMAIASLILTGGAALLMAVTGNANYAIFVAFLLFSQFQIFQSTSNRTPTPARQAADAERLAWQTGARQFDQIGVKLSPYYRAFSHVTSGQPELARDVMLSDLRRGDEPNWVPPTGATRDQLRTVTAVLPAELPTSSSPYRHRILAEVLLAAGEPARAGTYAVAGFERWRSSLMALVVARASSGLGDLDNALRWTIAATDMAKSGIEPDPIPAATASMIETAPELAAIRRDPQVVAALNQIRR